MPDAFDDANGNELTQTTALTTPAGVRTLVTRKAYDANNRVTSVTDAEGHTTRTVYNALGLRSATIDARLNRTEFNYDERGPQGAADAGGFGAAGAPATPSDQEMSVAFSSMPGDLVFDPNHQRLFVIDGNSHRVLIFDVAPQDLRNGMEAIAVIGQPGSVHQFQFARWVALSGGKLCEEQRADSRVA